MKIFIIPIIAFFCIILHLITTTIDRYPYVVSNKIMELSKVKEQEEIIGKQLGTNCWDRGPEELTYPEKTYMLDYNYYIIVEFISNCDLGDSVGFYKKSYYTCNDGIFGCSIRKYTYRAKLEKWKFDISLLDLLI